MPESPEIAAARLAMIAKRFGGTSAAQTGGKGSVRRKKKTASRSAGVDDRKLAAQIKKLGATAIPGIEEVNMFRSDGKVVHFSTPKVQATIASNTYFVSGNADTVNLESLLPGIVSQMGHEAIAALQAQVASMGAGGPGGGALPPGAGGAEEEDSDDDDVPDLIEGQDFEAQSNK